MKMSLRDWRLIVLEIHKSGVAANSKDLTTPCGAIKMNFQNFTEHEQRFKISFKDRHQNNLGFMYCDNCCIKSSLWSYFIHTRTGHMNQQLYTL